MVDPAKPDQLNSPPPLLRVLITEDDPRDAKLVASVLEGAGFTVQYEVTDSLEFFGERLQKADYDVILADFNLCNWTAMDALETLKQSGKDIPVIVVTGTLGDEAAVECIKQGAADFVLKDRPARLPAAVQRALGERRLREERKQADEAIRQSHAKLEQQTHQLRLLAEMGEMLQASSTPADAYAVTARFAQTLIPSRSGVLFVCSTSKDNLEVVHRWGEPHPNDPDFLATEECWGLRTGRVHSVEDPHTGLLCRHLAVPPPACYVCAPMIAHGETLGLLHLQMNQQNHASSKAGAPGSMELNWPVRTMAERLALALVDMNLREALRAQSICDPLTGWYNRRYMQETLERDIRRASRTKRPLSLLMFDIDNFKEFNDSFGHQAGDMALQNLCQVVKALIRSEDVACRYGGDEFVLILPDSSPELAAQRAEEMRIAARNVEMQYQGHLLEPITLSIGIATFPADARTSHELLRAADTVLFRAKREGRDRVRMHGNPLSRPPEIGPA